MSPSSYLKPFGIVAALVVAAASTASAATVPVARSTGHVLTLTQKVARSAAKANAIRDLTRKEGKSYTATLTGAIQDTEYLTNATIGGQHFSLIVDTGSSDTWVAGKNFSCFNLTSYPEPQSECTFGALYDPFKSSTYKVDPNKNFNISYGDGDFLTGTVGFETVAVGGLTVTSQEFGFVTDAAWNGDGISSGILGLAYPGLTSAFNGSDPSNDTRSDWDLYNPFFFTAIKQGAVSEPIFSVAINRGSVAAESNSSYDPDLGYLAFGTVAPVSVTDRKATVPIQYTTFHSNSTGYNFYLVNIDSYVFPGSSKLNTAGTAILDTGTTLLYAPTEIAKEYNGQFKPNATYDEAKNIYNVDCNAEAPAFAITIGGVQFNITAADVILPLGNGQCISGVRDGGEPAPNNNFILGDVFLHNVVATFNLSSNAVTLTERMPY